MSRLSLGERAVFDPLYRALSPRAMRFARAKLPEDQAADCSQAIMLRVFSRASEFERGRPVLPWFYAVAANEIRTRVRKSDSERKRSADEKHGLAIPSGDDPERTMLEQELRASLARAVSELDEPSADAIASMLDEARPKSTTAAFRKRVSRAYARLRLALGGPDGI